MNNNAYHVALIILSIGLLLSVAVGARTTPTVDVENLGQFPLEISGFNGLEDRFSDAIYAELDADATLYRHYRRNDAQVDLYIGYYGTAKGGRSNHNPTACLPGSGWAIIDEKRADISFDPEVNQFVTSLIATRDGAYVTMYHWYLMNSNEVAGSGLSQNVKRFKNRLMNNRDDGAYVQVSVFSNNAGLGRAQQMGLDFAREVNILLPGYWPEETE